MRGVTLKRHPQLRWQQAQYQQTDLHNMEHKSFECVKQFYLWPHKNSNIHGWHGLIKFEATTVELMHENEAFNSQTALMILITFNSHRNCTTLFWSSCHLITPPSQQQDRTAQKFNGKSTQQVDPSHAVVYGVKGKCVPQRPFLLHNSQNTGHWLVGQLCVRVTHNSWPQSFRERKFKTRL